MIFLPQDPPLSHEKRLEIYAKIGAQSHSDDTPPEKVIADDYNGDEDKYLRAMASWHGVEI